MVSAWAQIFSTYFLWMSEWMCLKVLCWDLITCKMLFCAWHGNESHTLLIYEPILWTLPLINTQISLFYSCSLQSSKSPGCRSGSRKNLPISLPVSPLAPSAYTQSSTHSVSSHTLCRILSWLLIFYGGKAKLPARLQVIISLWSHLPCLYHSLHSSHIGLLAGPWTCQAS